MRSPRVEDLEVLDKMAVQLRAEMDADIAAERKVQAMSTFRITHHYDIGNQDVFVTRRTGDVDPLRAALYCQFKSEEWFAESYVLTNLGIAAILVMHYGFRQAAAIDGCRTMDMYREREAACGPRYDELMADTSLLRDGLRESMTNFFD